MNDPRKMRVYARERVQYVWLLNPTLNTLEVYVLGDANRLAIAETFEGDDKIRAIPFDAIELDLAQLW